MALIQCPECAQQVSDKAASCPKCGHPIATGAAPSSDGAPNGPHDGAPAEQVVTCRTCGRPNWRTSSSCYSCGNALAIALEFPDVSKSLPVVLQKKLLEGEPVFAYIDSPAGCGTAASQLIVTDSRVILRGQEQGKRGGCNTSSARSLEIPINHVSSVSEETVDTGCGKAQGLGVSSGSAVQLVRAKNKKQIEGALRILQALIRASTTRR